MFRGGSTDGGTSGRRSSSKTLAQCGEPGGWLGGYNTRDHTSQKIMTSPVGIRGIDGEFAFGSR